MPKDPKEPPGKRLLWETSFPVEFGNPYAAPPDLEERPKSRMLGPMTRMILSFIYGTVAIALIWGFLLYALMALAELSTWR